MSELENFSEGVFTSVWSQYNRPERIVTPGHFYPKERAGTARLALQETKAEYGTSSSRETGAMKQNLGWTELINALNNERQWAIKRFFEILDPVILPGVAISVVPPHRSYKAFWPLRTLARQLADNGRVDATSCLIRRTTIQRITFGGASTEELHRKTIRVDNPSLIEGKRVLLLDDIAKSGASLKACRAMLLEAGAETVQAMALGRVIVGEDSPSQFRSD